MVIRSMFSAISGLRGHQTWMDVISNNIANLNTPGYKTARIRFEDMLAQTHRGASGPIGGNAGLNPVQIGLGVAVGGIDTIHTQGALQSTGRPGDLAIQGDGYFIVSNGTQTLYTRDGSFDIGIDHKLSNPSTGMYVLGWQADPSGNIDTTGPLGHLTIPLGQQLDAQPSTALTLQGNLDAGAAVGDTHVTTVTVFDSLGFQHSLTLTFTKTADNEWDWEYTSDDPNVTLTNATGSITFTDHGAVDTVTAGGPLTVAWGNGAADTEIADGGDFGLMTQVQAASTGNGVADGWTAGALISFTVDQGGQVIGVYSNGASKVLGQVATAIFANPGGLAKMGQNMWSVTANSGPASVGTPGEAGHGTIANYYLEMSNVDLAQQFTEMILAERGFQANSRMITTSDEILQETVNLKR